jgi:hypothetical protein
MARSRECLGGCGRRVGREHACPVCWVRLPERLREAVAGARRKSRAYSVALHDAHLWFTENPPPRTASEDLQRRAAS